MLKAIFRAADRADERINRWFSPQADEVRGQATEWGTWAGDSSSTSVTQSSALKLLAVTGSVQLLTESIATLPVDVFSRTSTGRAERPVPAWIKEPIIGLTFTDWCTQVLTSLLLHGNAYVVVTRNASRQIVELTPVDPQSVTVDRGGTMGGRKRYIVRGVPFGGEMVHIKGMMLPGTDVGLSPLEFAYQSIQLGLSAQDYGINSFDSGLKMPGVIEYPGAVDPAKMGETARLWQRSRRKGGHGLPGVLEGGGTFKAMGITNEAAQFLETRQWTAAEICAQVYLIDPRELGIPLTGSTLEYVNSESRLANLVRKGMLRWITRIESAVTALLPQPQYMKMNVAAFQRADSGERWDTYLKASQINATAAAVGQPPVLLTDEMRAWEELDPLPAVDMPDPPPVVDVVDTTDPTENDAMRSSAEMIELRGMVAGLAAGNQSQPVTVNLPDVRVDAPQIHVDAEKIGRAIGDMPAPVVNVTVSPTPVDVNVTNEVQPAAVQVTNEVQPAPVTVNVEPGRTKHTVKRDPMGNITEVIEEPV